VKKFKIIGLKPDSYVKLQTVTVFTLQITGFWDVTACSLVELHRPFRRACCSSKYPDAGSGRVLRNVPTLTLQYTESRHRKRQSLNSLEFIWHNKSMCCAYLNTNSENMWVVGVKLHKFSH